MVAILKIYCLCQCTVITVNHIVFSVTECLQILCPAIQHKTRYLAVNMHNRLEEKLNTRIRVILFDLKKLK